VISAVGMMLSLAHAPDPPEPPSGLDHTPKLRNPLRAAGVPVMLGA